MPTKPPFAQHARKSKADSWREYDQRRAESPTLAIAARIRNTPAWRQLSAHFLAVHPICGACNNAAARQTHHLVPVEKSPELALIWENLAPACTRCHAKCNALERQGEPTEPLFVNFNRLPAFGGLE